MKNRMDDETLLQVPLFHGDYWLHCLEEKCRGYLKEEEPRGSLFMTMRETIKVTNRVGAK